MDRCSTSGGKQVQGLVTLAHMGTWREDYQGTALDPLKVEMRKGGSAILAQSSGTRPRQGLRRSPCLYRSQRILLGL